MKTTILLFTFILGGFLVYSQDSDTTKIKIGDTKIIIIDKNADLQTQKDKTEQAKKEFEKMLEEKQKAFEEQEKMLEQLEQEFNEQQKNLEKQTEESSRKIEEQKMQELEKKLKETSKKQEELTKEMAALEKGLADLENKVNEDVEDAEDEDWDNDKFDWKWDKDWPKDWDNMSPFGRKKKFRGHWAGFELGLNNYMNPDNQFTLSNDDRGFELNAGGSWMFALNFLEFNIPFGKHAGLVTGVGTSWNNYKFRNNVNVYEDENGQMVALPETVKSYNRNSLHSWNFNFPLILELQVPSGKGSSGVYLGFGVVGTAKVSSWGNIEYILDGVKYEERRKSDFLQNSFRYGLTARLGLKYLRLFANYDLVPLFQKDRGPELYPVSVGVSLISF
jgi:hypothetical protein